MKDKQNLLYAMQIPPERKEYSAYGSFQEDWIDHISRLNIFVGENNSGKSRFLRSLFSTTDINNWPYVIDIKQVETNIDHFFNRIRNMFNSAEIKEYAGIQEKLSRFSQFFDEPKSVKTEIIAELINCVSNLSKQFTTTKEFGEVTYRENAAYHNFNSVKFNNELLEVFATFIAIIINKINQSRKSYTRLYIPTLRGLREIGNTNDDYKQRTMDDYFNNLKPPFDTSLCTVFTGLDLYNEIKAMLLGNLEQRKKIADFQIFLGENFFDGKIVTLIPHIDSKVLHVKIGNEAEKRIYLLGDGIQSIIIMTFPLFLKRDNPFLLFIEEPELYLHPALQRKLIEVFMLPEFEKTQVFFTTHSNHFLDLTLDIGNISIFTFSKKALADEANAEELEPEFIIENISNDDARALELLGVNNSSVLLSNCTVWVEGITDRLYIRHMLNLFIDSDKSLTSYQEDLHFSFVEYSGNNITHWSFLETEVQEGSVFQTMNVERLCGKLMLITDRDGENKNKRHEILAQKLQERYYCLPCKEIENILHPIVIEKVVKEYEGTDKIKFKTKLTASAYKSKKLGEYLNLNLVNRQRKAGYASDSGTINDKVNFCRKAICQMKSIDDMTPESIDMCEQIYDFIKKHNSV